MGKRFVLSRHIHDAYSDQKVFFLLNEADVEAHRLRPYGYSSGKFSYHQMFQKHQSRMGRRCSDRSVKKTVRQRERNELLWLVDDSCVMFPC